MAMAKSLFILSSLKYNPKNTTLLFRVLVQRIAYDIYPVAMLYNIIL